MQRESHARLFGDSRAISVELHLLYETYQEACQIARENGWDQDYANLVIFANGISFLRETAKIERVNSGDAQADQVIQKLTAELQQYTAMYAVMKYQAFLKTADNESMDWALNALRIENRGLKSRIDMFRADEEQLKHEMGRLQGENARLRGQLALAAAPQDQDEPQGAKRTLWLRRLRERFHASSK